MAHFRSNGFTIIETSLVLAITGLLVAMILLGIGSSLSHQRYTDAVNQSIAFFRSQYSQTTNVLNDREKTDALAASSCGATASEGQTPGSSDCLLLGNVLRSSDGKTVTTYQVIGRHDPSSDNGVAAKTDAQILTSALLQQGNQTGTYSLEWGSTLLNATTSDPAKFSMMVLRVPVSGTVVTYTSSSDTTSVSSLLGLAQADMKLCVDQAGFFSIGIPPMGVLVKQSASNTSGVQPISSGDCA